MSQTSLLQNRTKKVVVSKRMFNKSCLRCLPKLLAVKSNYNYKNAESPVFREEIFEKKKPSLAALSHSKLVASSLPFRLQGKSICSFRDLHQSISNETQIPKQTIGRFFSKIGPLLCSKTTSIVRFSINLNAL